MEAHSDQAITTPEEMRTRLYQAIALWLAATYMLDARMPEIKERMKEQKLPFNKELFLKHLFDQRVYDLYRQFFSENPKLYPLETITDENGEILSNKIFNPLRKSVRQKRPPDIQRENRTIGEIFWMIAQGDKRHVSLDIKVSAELEKAGLVEERLAAIAQIIKMRTGIGDLSYEDSQSA